jgi:hypothetical protein
VVTVEHVSTWRLGSNFFFLDVGGAPDLDFFAREVGLYFEYAPVLSLSRLTGRRLAAGPLADVGVTAQVNTGRNNDGSEIPRVVLEGVELAWSVPGFDALVTQLLARHEHGLPATWQVTTVADRPFAIGRARLRARGFLDVWRRPAGGGVAASTVVVAQPQLLLELARAGGTALMAGIELELSRDYPDPAVHRGWDLAVSPMVRWVF